MSHHKKPPALGQLHGGKADATAGAVHEYSLASLGPRLVHQGPVRRVERNTDSRPFRAAHVGRQSVDLHANIDENRRPRLLSLRALSTTRKALVVSRLTFVALAMACVAYVPVTAVVKYTRSFTCQP